MSSFYGPRGFAGITSDGYQQRDVICGSGSPESVVPADPGAIYKDITAGTFYHKATGYSTTGWTSAVVSGAISGTTGTFTGVVTVPDGTAAAPGLRTTTEASGLYRASATSLGLTVAGTAAASLSSAGVLAAVSGFSAAAAGAYKFASRSQMTSTADGTMRFFAADGTTPSAIVAGAVSGTTGAFSDAVSGTTGTFTGVLKGADGAVGAPGVRLTTEATGLYRVSAFVLGLTVDGTAAATISKTGIITAVASFAAPADGAYAFTGRSQLTSTADGMVRAFAADGTTPSAFTAGALTGTAIVGTTVNGTVATFTTSTTTPSENVSSTNGALWTVTSVEANITCSGATSSASNLIPAGAQLMGFGSRVTTTVTSGDGATSFTIGDGTTADLYGTGIVFTAGTTTGSAQYKTPLVPLEPAGRSVTLTATGGTFSGGVVRVVAFYRSVTGPTA